MSRFSWRMVPWLVLLPLLACSSLPFTEWGSRLLVDNAGRLLPLEIGYGGGTLAGELQLSRLAWSDEAMQLALNGIVLEVTPRCLWYSKVCFRQLSARHLAITMLPDPAGETDPPGADSDETLFEFPVPLEAPQLQLDSLSVQWQGGEWRQGRMAAGVHISGHTIRVERVLVENAHLQLTGAGDADNPFVPPDIHLPLALLVDHLSLEQVAWDLSGETGEVELLLMSDGEWREKSLRLGQLQLRSGSLGEWQAAGGIEFSGQWPLTVEGAGRLPEVQAWPGVLGRALTLELNGDLAALAVRAESGGEVAVAASGVLNTLDPALPFRLVTHARWPGALALSELGSVPEPLATTVFTAPVRLDASGSLHEQVFQLEATVSSLGYDALDLRLAGSHTPGRLALEDLRLRDAEGINTLWGTGELQYSDRVQWSAVLETSGLELLPLAAFGSGRIAGQVQVAGELAGEVWQVSVTQADLDGTLNGLPASLSGQAGINSKLQLLPGELQAELNGTRLLLHAPADTALPGRLDIELDDLERWQTGTRGSISLQATLAPGWDYLSVSGSLRDIEWQALRIGSGRIDGNYRPPEAGTFNLDVTLADLALAGLELDTTRLSTRGNSTAGSVSLHSRGDIDGALELSGRAGSGGTWAGQLAPATLQTSAGNWYLGEAVAVEFSPSPARLSLAAHCWQFGQGRVCPGATLLAEEGHTSLALDGDLVTLNSFLPQNLEVEGIVKGQFSAAWSSEQAVTIDGEASGRDIRITRHFGSEESGSVTWQAIDASVHNDARGLSLVAAVTNAGARIVDLDLHLPADKDQAIAGTLGITGLQLSTLAPFAPGLSLLAGELRGQLQLSGTLDQPLADGGIYLSDGEFALLGNPTELRQLALQLEARGDRGVLQGRGSLGGGQVTLDGTVLSRPEWQLELALAGDHHEILLPPYTQMLVSEQLEMQLTGGLLALTGDVVVHEGSLEHEQLPEGGVTLSDDVVEVDLNGNVIYESAPFDVSMNVGILIEDKFKIVGDMVNATLGGDLQLRQEPRQPLQVFGNLNVIGGELRAYQQRLRIQRGTVSFAGTPENPELDVRAQREISANNVVVGLQLQGTLNQPKLEVYSDPVMSHGETMSYLVRGRGLDSGAGTDGVAMALSVGSSLVNQSALVTELNSIPGISNLAFGAEGSTESDTAATVGGYIGERLYLSYGMGIYEPINVLTARLYLQTRLWLEVVSRLENSVDLYYSFDID